MPRPRSRRIASIPASLLGLLFTSGAVFGGAGATTVVEAGAIFDFLAPDAGSSTDGAITFGYAGTLEVIAADAVLAPPADTNLAFLAGGTPTCVEVTRESDVITAMAFVAQCTVTGPVTLIPDAFGSGSDAYLIADDVAAPAELVAEDPGFAALLGAPAATGATVSITFMVDPAVGAPEAILGVTEISGPVGMLPGGDVALGAATLPNDVVDDASRALLGEAADLGVEATVEIVGTAPLDVKGNPVLDVTLSVSFSAPAGPDPSAEPSQSAEPSPTAAQLPDTRDRLPATPAVPASLLAIVALGALLSAAAVRVRSRR